MCVLSIVVPHFASLALVSAIHYTPWYSYLYTWVVVGGCSCPPKSCSKIRYSHGGTGHRSSYGPGMTFHSYVLLYSGSFPLCRWFCHFDDDTYVNIPALVKSLQQFNPESERLYLGHMPSKFAGIPERWKSLTKVRYHP